MIPSRHILSRHLVVIFALTVALVVPDSVMGQTLSESERSRLDARFQSLLAEEEPNTGLSVTGVTPQPVQSGTRAKQGESRYGAAIYTSDVQELRNSGIALNSVYPDFVTARLTPSDLLSLAQMDDVKFVSSGSRMYPTNDVTAGATGANALQNAEINGTSYTGQGALVCVIDTGIDWDHEDFRGAANSSNSRIRYIWDQTISPQGNEQDPSQRGGSDLSGFDYGVEYGKSDIESAFGTTGNVRTEDVDGHGTHVAGTAVSTGGAHPDQKYQGMAPEANLIVVKAGNGSFPFSNVIDGMNYCGEVAEDENKPVVVNMSLGTPAGPHDGTSPQAQAIDSFVGNGKVAVVSAGNDGSSGMHYQSTLSAGSSTSFDFSIGSYTAQSGAGNDDAAFDIWFNTADDVSVTVTSPNGEVVSQGAGGQTTSNTPDGAVYISNQVNNVNNDRHVEIRVFDQNASETPVSGRWSVEFTDQSGNGNSFHSWFIDRNLGTNQAESPVIQGNEVKAAPQKFAANYTSGGNSRFTIGSPGTASKALTVGAWSHRQRWYSADGSSFFWNGFNTDNIASFSSIGPRRDGVLKPEITAPGDLTASSLSQDAPVSSNNTFALPGGKHWLLRGTSMASPAVAGAVALLFEEDGSLSASRVKSLITNQATTDSYTRNVPSNTWGYGKLDVFRAMAELTGSKVPEREMLAYDENASNSNRTDQLLGGGSVEKAAVRVTPNISGTMTGALLHVSFGDANGLTDSLNVEVWDDNGNGLPGTKQGNTIKVPPSGLSNHSWNYIPLTGTGVSVAKNTDYHLVMYPDNPKDSLRIYAENQSVDGRSSIMTGGSSNRLRHQQAENPDEVTFAKTRTKQGSWGQLTGKDLSVRAFVSSTKPSNLAVNVSSLDFTLLNPSLPTPVQFVTSVSVENNGEPVQNLSAGDFTVTEEGKNIPVNATSSKQCSLTPPGQGINRRLADIVFIVDNSGSMGFEQDDVVANIENFVDELRSRGVNSALGLTRYGQSATGDLGQVSGGPIFENQGNLTTDGQFFKNDILARNVTRGGNEPGYFATEQSVSNFTFRSGAKKIFVVATDETPAQETGLADIDDAKQAVVNGGITLYAATESRLYDDFKPLTNSTGGQVFDIFDPFANTVADAITGQTSSTYLLTCLSPSDFTGSATSKTLRSVDITASASGVTDNATATYDIASRPRVTVSKQIRKVASTQQPANQDLTVQTGIQTFGGGSSNALGTKSSNVSAQIYYRKVGSGNTYSSVQMQQNSSGAYEGSIPQSEVESPGMEFYIQATDSDGDRVTLPSSNAATNPIKTAVAPNNPPTVDHDLIKGSSPENDLTITAEASDDGSVDRVTLFYRMQGDLAYSQLSMSNTSGSTYEATVPGDEITSAGIEYYIEAEDDLGITNTVGLADDPLVELSQPSLAGPGDQTLGLPDEVEVDYNSVFRALKYEVQWATDSDFPSSATSTKTVEGTSAKLTGLSDGTKYYWRVRPVRNQAGPFSKVREFETYPDQIETAISRSFDDASKSTSYRLVALPGDRSTGIASILSGNAGSAWQAYRDDGSSLISFEEGESSEFTFEPGSGYWVLSENEVSVTDSKPTVSIGNDYRTSVSLHDGWNIISNPLDRGVSWSQVVDANGGSLQSLWTFTGSYKKSKTFASASKGKAYYFLNDQGLDELVIPYPSAPSTSGSASKSDSGDMLVLETFQDGRKTSTAKVGLRSGAEKGIDSFDQFAPPSRFESSSLRFVTKQEADRQNLLAHEYRASSEDNAASTGRTFDMRLSAPSEEKVEISASGLKTFEGQEVVLVHPSTGNSFNLRSDSKFQVTVEGETTPVQLLVGDAEFVENKRKRTLPEKVTLHGNYPNPFSQQTTITYALPEKQKHRLEVYDVMGRRVAVLVNDTKRAGTHRIQWNGRAEGNRPVASGVYLIRLKAKKATQVKKVTVVR